MKCELMKCELMKCELMKCELCFKGMRQDPPKTSTTDCYVMYSNNLIHTVYQSRPGHPERTARALAPPG